MKRYGYLFQEVCSFENLLLASKKAQRGKRFKHSTSEFNLNLEENLFRIQGQLQRKDYQIGQYKNFYVYDPKRRFISALPYEDRVIQHALCNVIEPIFDQAFIYDNYACRKGKGSHKAVSRFTEYSRRNKYVLKCDIKDYFASIDHEILLKIIQRKIKDPDVLWMIRTIIESTQNPGIPIGNLTSQIFANLYLNGLDYYIKEKLRCRYYLRYMDDLIFFGNNRNELRLIRAKIDQHLGLLSLCLHSKKSQIYEIEKGVKFLGYKIYPTHRLVLTQNLKRLRKRLRRYFWLIQKGFCNRQKLVCSIQSWLGYAIHADSYNIRKKVLSEFDLKGISP